MSASSSPSASAASASAGPASFYVFVSSFGPGGRPSDWVSRLSVCENDVLHSRAGADRVSAGAAGASIQFVRGNDEQLVVGSDEEQLQLSAYIQGMMGAPPAEAGAQPMRLMCFQAETIECRTFN